ncbi:MAG: hypothetical protein IPH35_08070 [Rhodoferax sp.]|nr:hypothetical protein [Rhodoferax sp.]
MKSHSRINIRRQAKMPNVTSKVEVCNQSLTAIGTTCLLLTLSAAQAAPLSLSQRPPGNGSVAPAPNVIITVDDSGSMAWDVSSTDARSKISLLKESLKTQFGNGTANSGKIPDKRIRLAWQAMHNNGGAPNADTLTPGKVNAMRSFEGDHRKNFNTFVDSLKADNGTPSLKMMRQAHDYMRTPAGKNSPWADVPGTAQTTPYMACRRTYHVFMTDGAWNSITAADKGIPGDSISKTLPDGTSYSVMSNQTKVYRDAYGDTDATHASSFADLAFRSWATDLQDGTNSTQNMANSVNPLTKKGGTETFETPACKSASNCIATQEYWNPKNDPATWQHINTYTIGFGEGATEWTPPDATCPANWETNTTNDNYGGDFAKLIQGSKVWPDVKTSDGGTPDIRTIELWHGALNGRGRYYPAKTADDLTEAFKAIMDTVIDDTTQSSVSVATSSSYLRLGTSAYTAGYDANMWSGVLRARAIDSVTGAVATTDTWNAGDLLDNSNYSVANRFVLSYNGSAGFPWKTFDSLPTKQQTQLNKNSADTVDNKGQNRIDYIRGDRTKEGGIFRNRASRLGDIVNSNIWYVGAPASGYTMNNYAAFKSIVSPGKGGRTKMVYVGANDGMLHGFAAADNLPVKGGTELLAYIPQGIAEGKLRKLTDTTYTHEYFVDGSPFTGDAYLNSAWTTVLVGTLGNGGKGYFVLDVTDPANFTTTNAANLVIKDTTKATNDADIGFISSPPTVDPYISSKSGQIVQMNNGRWALVMGNGYNSNNEAPVLIIQYLDGTKTIVRISPCGGQTVQTSGCAFQGNGNGLSSPLLVDLNGNGKVDVAYAGDLQGNLWKFNLSSATPSNWEVSFGGQPFFVAKGPASLGPRSAGTVAQPITTAPYWMPHPLGGIMVSVGTGQNLTTADQTSTTVASYYGLWDNSPFTVAAGIVTINEDSKVTSPVNIPGATASMDRLVQQTINATPFLDAGVNYYTSTSNPVAYTTSDAGTDTPTDIAATKRGWFLDWSTSGQRVLTNTRPYSGQNIVVQTTIPKSGSTSSVESCAAVNATDERSFLSILDMINGAPPSVSPFDLSTDNPATTTMEVDSDTALVQTKPTEMLVIKATGSLLPTDPICVANPNDPRCKLTLDVGAHLGKRTSWRNKQ